MRPVVIRVATVPVVHPDLVALLPDGVLPVPAPATADAGAWLDPEHLVEHAGDVDVLHLHAGPGHLTTVGTPEQTGVWTEAWTAALRRTGVPLVLTVHDLRDPEDDDRERYDTLLAALLDPAEVVLAPTVGAAEEIADRHGRTAIAIGHPAQVDRVPGVDRETRLVGVHLGSLPGNLAEPVAVVRAALSGAVSGGGRLRVDVHAGVHLPEVEELAAAGQLELTVDEPLDARGVVAYLQQLHVSVLPHRIGTDAAWLEACRDVGTRVVAPSAGHYGELWSDVVEYGNDEETGLDPTSLIMAVVAALTRPAPARADPAWRADQRQAVQRVLADVYERVIGDRAAGHHRR